MAANMRKAVDAVTDFVFPVPKPNRDQQEHYLLKWGCQEYVSSLPLQMALYFNMFYYPLWLTTEIVMLVEKFNALSSLYQIVLIAILIFMTIIESFRTYIGYVGNLMEKISNMPLLIKPIASLLLNQSYVVNVCVSTINGVNANLHDSPLPKVPQLVAYWLLTLLLQTPLALFLLLNGQTIITPIERAVTIVLTAFVLIEVVLGYFAIRAMVNSQVNKFPLQQFSPVLLEEIDDPYEDLQEPTTVRFRGLGQSFG